MITGEYSDADSAWRDLASDLRARGRVQEGRDQPTRELTHTVFTLRDPRQRVVFSRPINPAFAIAEVIAILAGSDDVSFLGFWNPRMRQYSDDGIRFCGAYGYRLGSQPKLPATVATRLRHWALSEGPKDQLRMAYDALTAAPPTRQVVLQYWDGTLDMPNPLPRSKDIPCNLVSHVMIRQEKLEWLQVMRSNDLFWGLPYNFIQFTTLQEVLAGWLGIQPGSYVHISDSLHAYRRHWRYLDSIPPVRTGRAENLADLRIRTYEAWERIFGEVVDCALRLTEATSSEELLSTFKDFSHLPPAYREWMALLTAEALRRRGFRTEAVEIVNLAGPLWKMSWQEWARKVDGPRQELISVAE